MLERAEQQLASVKTLLRRPTPENFETAGQQLSALHGTLLTLFSGSSAQDLQNPRNAAFLKHLPTEMAQIGLLLQHPVSILEGLVSLRIQTFGSYNRQGEISSLESSARTISHL